MSERPPGRTPGRAAKAQATPPADTPAAHDALRDALDDEAEAIAERRRIALPAPAGASADDPRLGLPRVGLALSGGGMRSATFCFGLLRGLAGRGLLGRIDYLSTVSGGGYVGAMFGRLVCALGIHEAEAALGRGGSLLLWWLRRNGRYLTPAGSRDLGMAAATYLRAWVAIHTEFGILAIAGGVIVALPHVLQHDLGWVDPLAWQRWQTPWWPLAVAGWLLLAPGAMAAYWIARDPPLGLSRDALRRRRSVARDDAVLLGLIAALALALGWQAWHTLAARPDFLPPYGLPPWTLVGALVAAGVALRLGVEETRLARVAPGDRAAAVAAMRNRLTRRLRTFSRMAAVLAAIGLLDLASWRLLLAFSSDATWWWSGLGLGGAVVALRVLAEPLQKLAQKSDGPRTGAWGPRLLNLAGMLALLLLVLLWTTAVQWLVFDDQSIDAARAWPSWLRAATLLGAALAWTLLTGGNADMPNASSLHSFYRARLTRAYLSVGNPARFGGAGAGAAAVSVIGEEASEARLRDVKAVTDVVAGDDIALADYRPQARGGPIHLVNACLNQSRDDKSGLYNADRKGGIVTAAGGSGGFEVGAGGYVLAEKDRDYGSLGRWVAMSGAAAAPGAGSYTSSGWALTLFFLGVRLGHWLPSPLRDRGTESRLERLLWGPLIKQSMLASEAAASFRGAERPWWYLSDGGHFENTGVYALLRRELEFIILADCSADAVYEFGDIENLVRKARIDFDADIEFYTRADAAHLFTLPGGDLTVLSPEDMPDNQSARGVLLARICYHRSDPARCRTGTLLVVKPNLHRALDVDLLAYAARNPTFPHQSTGDQFFDEAQWESYHRLGEDFGRALHASWLAQLPGWSRPSVLAQAGNAPLRRPVNAAPTVAPATAALPPWRRSARAAAVGATVGVGLSGTLLLAAWQAFDQFGRERAAQHGEATRQLAEAARDLKDFRNPCVSVGVHTTLAVGQLRTLAGGPRLPPGERDAVARLLDQVRQACLREVDASAQCLAQQNINQQGVCSAATASRTVFEPLDYWAGTASAEQRAWQQQGWRRSFAWLPFTVRPPVLASTAPAADDTPPPPPPPPPADTAAAAAGAEAGSGAEAAAAATVAPSALAACAAYGPAVTLYTQIYDEASRPLADALRSALASEPGARPRIVVPATENVTRSAELREQRRPVPWRTPTFIVHAAALEPCAADIARAVAAPLKASYGDDVAPTVRRLPSGARAQRGVIELWLPPAPAARSASGDERY